MKDVARPVLNAMTPPIQAALNSEGCEATVTIPRSLALRVWGLLAQECSPCAREECQITSNPDEAINECVAALSEVLRVAPCAVPTDADKLDAMRYRWLRAGTKARQGQALERRGGRYIPKNELQALMEFGFWCDPEQLDTAIDAAIRATRETKDA